MRVGHVPIRTCVACRKRRPKSELVRFTSGGRSRGGRGAYLCRDAACVEMALMRMDVRKRLGPSASAEVLEGLGTATTLENCLDGSSPGSVICDECHGGGAVG